MKKTIFLAVLIPSFFAFRSNAQCNAQRDNGTLIGVKKDIKMDGLFSKVTLTLTNNTSQSMDVDIYKEGSNGTWWSSFKYDLKPDESYKEDDSFTGATEKYIIYTSPHGSRCKFPSSADIGRTQ